MPRRSSSSCRQFRRLHVEYVDGLLSEEARSACQAHLDDCPACAGHDVRIRRSLLTLQALTPIEVSDGFHDRLCDRLSQEVLHYTPTKTSRAQRTFQAIAGAIIAAAAVLMFAAARTRPAAPPRLSPVLARTPEAPARVFEPTTPPMTATAASPRFEAVPGRAPLQSILQAPHLQSVRLQSVTYIGQ